MGEVLLDTKCQLPVGRSPACCELQHIGLQSITSPVFIHSKEDQPHNRHSLLLRASMMR